MNSADHDPTPHRLSVCVIGSPARAELRTALEVLGACDVMYSPTAEETLRALVEGAAPPDVMVLVEDRPGEITHEAVDALRHLAPLARMIGLLGSWCEGETRTGRPWPGVLRMYWHQFAARMRAELERMGRGDGSSWALPLTAADEERLIDLDSTPLPPTDEDHKSDAGPRIAIVAATTESYDWLSAVGRGQGLTPLRLSPDPADWPATLDVQAAIWDVPGTLDAEMTANAGTLVARIRSAPLMVLANFPRAEQVAALREAGASMVLSKPLRIDDLQAAIGVGRSISVGQ